MFVHVSALERGSSLSEGQKVSYDIGQEFQRVSFALNLRACSFLRILHPTAAPHMRFEFTGVSLLGVFLNLCGDQPTEDDQARNVWPSGPRASQNADDANQIG